MVSPIIPRRKCQSPEVSTPLLDSSPNLKRKLSLQPSLISPSVISTGNIDDVNNDEPLSKSQELTKIRNIKVKSDRSLFSLSGRRLRPGSDKLCKSLSELDTATIYHDAISPIKIVDHIGWGSYSYVYKGIRLDDSGEIIAVKIINKSKDTDSDDKNFKAEENAFSRLNGLPGIIEYIGIVREKSFSVDFFDNTLDWAGFCMKYYEHGDIHKYMSSGNELRNEVAHSWIIDVITGLSSLHNLEPILLHRDVKSKNIIIDNDFSLKLTDFGSSRYDNSINRSNTLRESRTSMFYSPPELFSEDDTIYLQPSDIYALTIVIWEILSYVLTGKYKPPFKVSSPWQLPKIIIAGTRPETDEKIFGKDWIALLENGWNQDISKRPSLTEMMSVCKNITIPSITCMSEDDNA
jgi:serine/threonine protein kinase